MIFEKIEEPMKGLFVMDPKVFIDDRGCFLETFSIKDFGDVVGNYNEFVQENQSLSLRKGVLRGLHLQLGGDSQSKLVRVTNGGVLDVAVDLRPGSPTFGKHYSTILDSENCRMMYIPRGFAHGFVTLDEYTTFVYKCDNYYNPKSECTILYDDVDLNIDWGGGEVFLSDKDLNGVTLKGFINKYSHQH